MASEVKCNKISPATGTAFQFGDSGDTFTIPSGVTLTNNGSSSGFDSGLASVQTFTSSGTWTRPTGITKVIVEVQGAGGSGTNGGSGSNQRNNGGSGGYVKKLLNVSSISTATITIGAAGAANTGTSGNDGGNSIWSDGTNTLTSGGGKGPNGTTSHGGLGGTATGGDLNIVGQNGGGYFSKGGDSQFGYGGVYGISAATGGNADNTSIPAEGYGSGGCAVYNGTASAGAAGIVIVTEYK